MAYNLKSEEDVKDYLHNLEIEYKFGCYSEKKGEVCHLLADFLEAIKKDFKKAGAVYKENCDVRGHAKSCYKYGNYLLVGRGDCKKNYKAAYDYYERACGAGEADACFYQALLLVAEDENMQGVRRDVPKAVSLMERSCSGKNDKACFHLSSMYLNGVKRNSQDPGSSHAVSKDMRLAFKYAVEGCNLGNVYCCANLSQMYARGDGVEKNAELARKYKSIATEMQNEMQTTNTLTFQQGLK